MPRLNEYPATCDLCGENVPRGAGRLISRPYQDAEGIWHAHYVVQHVSKCSPVRIRVCITNGQVSEIQVDGKAVVLMDNLETNQVSKWEYHQMHTGEVLSFDMALHDLEKQEVKK